MRHAYSHKVLARAAIASHAQMHLTRKPRKYGVVAKSSFAAATLSLGVMALLALPANFSERTAPEQIMQSLQKNGG
ncbi:MAG: hypothetical protein ACR2OJ_05880 [Hyphomicrobiales bacterium]